MSEIDPRNDLIPLCSVLESVGASIGALDLDNRLEIDPGHSATLLLIDGLGAELVTSHPHDAPNLYAAMAHSVTVAAGFPASTAVSLTSLATGQASGAHGIVGYSFRTGEASKPDAEVLKALLWSAYDDHKHDLRDTIIPEQFQTIATVFEKCRAQGFDIGQIVPQQHLGSGMSRAILRGANSTTGADSTDALRDAILASMRSANPTMAYAYYGGLDMAGHIEGPGSAAWREQLQKVDRLVGELTDALPAGRHVVVTGDHGMVDTSTGRFDIDSHRLMGAGTTAIAGEARVRHIYTEPGAADDVLSTWQTVLGDRATVLRRDDAIDAGWFGPTVHGDHRVRIGDLVAAARGTTAMIRTVAEPLEATLIGQHGAWDSAEQLVPAIVIRGNR